MTKVFLSYSRADETHAERLYKQLTEYGLDVWFDKESLLPGQSWEEEIRQEIQRSDYVILLLSKKSVGKRGFFQKEVRLALEVLDTIPIGHVYLLPIRIDECEVPARLTTIQYLDLFPQSNHSLEKLYKSIKLYDEIRSRAEAAETQEDNVEAIRLLLVNDQPATMNFVVDLWKSCGVTVDYAFDVPQAIHAIEQSFYHVIVSDLSHFSPAGLITDRAAFEILEWARNSEKKVKVIISTSDLSPERQKIAQELGAIGICNVLPELNRLLKIATGLEIDYPSELSTSEVMEVAHFENKGMVSAAVGRDKEPTYRYRVYISYSRADHDFASRLAKDLERHGIAVLMEKSSIPTGLTWAAPTIGMIRESDAMLAIISRHSVHIRELEHELYEGKVREDALKRPFVIPLLIESVEKMPYFVAYRQVADFRGNYEKAFIVLLQSLDNLIPQKGA
jgi:CheY-like chemotaxis protein